jgi:WD40 repeat protein
VEPEVPGVALSADGKRIAVSGRGTRDALRILDAGTGKELSRLRMREAHAIQFSPDGKLLATAGDASIGIYDSASGELKHQFEGGGRGFKLVFSANSKVLAGGAQGDGRGSKARAWDLTTGKEIGAFSALQDGQISVALSADGKVLATWGRHHGRSAGGGQTNQDYNQIIQLWDLTTGKEIKQLVKKGQYFPIGTVAFSPDGKRLATAEGGGVRVWEIESEELLYHSAGRRGDVAHLTYSPDGKTLVAANQDGAFQLWDADTGKRRGVYRGPKCNPAGLAFVDEDKITALGVVNQVLCLWDVRTGKVLTPMEGHQGMVTSVAFAAGGKVVISAGTDAVRYWDAHTGKELRQVVVKYPYEGRRDRQQVFAISPIGKYLAGGEDGYLALWEAETGEELFAMDGGNLLSGAFSADERFLATSSRTHNGGVMVWDLMLGRIVGQFTAKEGRDRCLALSSDGKLLAIASNLFGNQAKGGQACEINLWDTMKGKEVCKIARDSTWIQTMAFSPDGTLLATAGRDTAIRLWETATGKELRAFEGDAGNITSNLAFSPDGRTVAVASQNGQEDQHQLRVWEVDSSSLRHEILTPRGGIRCLAYSPDSRTLATGSADTTVLLWDVGGRRSAEKTLKLEPDDLNALWTALADTDGRKGHRAMMKLTASPSDAVAFLRKRIEPAATLGEKEIEKLLADLDNEDFTVRDKASRGLERVGKAAKAALTKALEQKPAAEKRRRIEELLEGFEKSGPASDLLQPMRALEVLEHIATPEAREALEALAKGPPDAKLTREAKAILQRLPK